MTVCCSKLACCVGFWNLNFILKFLEHYISSCIFSSSDLLDRYYQPSLGIDSNPVLFSMDSWSEILLQKNVWTRSKRAHKQFWFKKFNVTDCKSVLPSEFFQKFNVATDEKYLACLGPGNWLLILICLIGWNLDYLCSNHDSSTFL